VRPPEETSVHACVLEREQLHAPVASQATEVERLVVHAPHLVSLIRIIEQPSGDFGQLPRGGLQVTFNAWLIGTELLVHRTEELYGQGSQVGAAEVPIQRDNVPGVLPHRFEVRRISVRNPRKGQR
jgi:hypothetical protein